MGGPGSGRKKGSGGKNSKSKKQSYVVSSPKNRKEKSLKERLKHLPTGGPTWRG